MILFAMMYTICLIRSGYFCPLTDIISDFLDPIDPPLSGAVRPEVEVPRRDNVMKHVENLLGL